jgi:hypothetical protein
VKLVVEITSLPRVVNSESLLISLLKKVLYIRDRDLSNDVNADTRANTCSCDNVGT